MRRPVAAHVMRWWMALLVPPALAGPVRVQMEQQVQRNQQVRGLPAAQR